MKSAITAGGAIFGKLKALGIDYVFANSGTDFPPVIEGLVEARRQGLDLPIPVTVPHEHAAVSMAHGAWQVTGRPQAVLLHTNVGLSNGATGLINAWCDQVPMIVMSGRTPVTEHTRFGARTVPIGWGQEMFDQEALIRETTKWHYELRFPEQISDLLDRAWAIANSTPKGPVYLSLPREVLCEPCPPEGLDRPSRIAPVVTAPEPAAVQRAAEALVGAERPLILSQRGAGSAEGFAALAQLCDDFALPLSHYWSNQIAMPIAHPMQVGSDPAPWLAEADVVLVLDALAPWFPDKVTLRDDVTVIQAGPDPLFSRTPVRMFPAAITLSGPVDGTVAALGAAMRALPPDAARVEARRTVVAQASDAARTAVRAQAEAGRGAPMSKEWVALCLGEVVKGRKATVFHELGCPLQPLMLDQPDSYFQEPHSGGLGWGLPAAMGGKLADPERLVFATIGDGSYMFANPTACHQVAEAQGIAVVTLVLNNEEWGAVRHSVEGLYPEGHARATNEVPLTSLRPSPDFALTAAASRAWTETVTDGADLPAALERAVEAADAGRQALLNIAIARVT
ncbi:thiamine pyrophosphate-requiring protein [Sagittula sp. MA-2]|jgi:acetolactate synthase-1/2/3 large subunit|uniref:thiamine pyrophosphate-requiring protein n=1 Tax=Sagittula sp. MA-2 TaxID=3048007 RepID=UPI0024C2CFD3|nr:thiamine pyrophosphate-requiring protein [Sagittula sp. MA-2]WHZ33559.1 thiamine pyrophosphate-requiring protein [Sagittula sp. MA-2]